MRIKPVIAIISFDSLFEIGSLFASAALHFGFSVTSRFRHSRESGNPGLSSATEREWLRKRLKLGAARPQTPSQGRGRVAPTLDPPPPGAVAPWNPAGWSSIPTCTSALPQLASLRQAATRAGFRVVRGFSSWAYASLNPVELLMPCLGRIPASTADSLRAGPRV